MEYKPLVLEIKLSIQTYSILSKLNGRAKMPNNALFRQYLSDELKSNHLKLVLYFTLTFFTQHLGKDKRKIIKVINASAPT